MKPSKTLALKKEVLAELSSADLVQVVGGLPTNPVNLCLSIQVCEITQNIRCLVPTGNTCA